MVDGQYIVGIARHDAHKDEWVEVDLGYVLEEPEFEGYVIRVTPVMFWLVLVSLILVGFVLGFFVG